MKKFVTTVFALFSMLMMGTAALADNASKAEDLVNKAIDHYKAVGHDAALTSFNDKSGEFVDGQFYVIVFTDEGIFKSHAFNPKLIDNPKLPALKDMNGKLITPAMVEAGKNGGASGGWAEYIWKNPETDKLAPKKTFVKTHAGYMFGVGYYD